MTRWPAILFIILGGAVFLARAEQTTETPTTSGDAAVAESDGAAADQAGASAPEQEATDADAPTPIPEAVVPAIAVTIELDVSDAPHVSDWAEKAVKLCETWYPKVAHYLASDNFTPPTTMKLVFKSEMEGIAFASGNTVTISAKWITDHPDDFGMVIHEMTHVIQQYRRRQPSWMVEGVADYIRFYQFEPNAPRPRIHPQRSSYRDSYRTTAAFFAWLVETQDSEFVRKLNARLRTQRCNEAVIEELLGQSVDDAWQAFIRAQRERR